MTYLQLTGHRVSVVDERNESSGPYRMDGTVVFFDADDASVSLAGDVTYGDDECFGRLAELAVHSASVPSSIDDAADYVVVAGVATRARHLVGRLQRIIDRTVRTIYEQSPWEAMRASANVQRDAIVMRSELTGRAGYFLRTFKLQRLYKDLSPTFGVPADDLAAFDQSVQDLQGFSTTLLGLAVDRSQTRFSVYGLLFAVFSLAFSSVAILDFANAQPTASRIWAVVAFSVTMASFSMTVLFFSYRHGRLSGVLRRRTRQPASRA